MSRLDELETIYAQHGAKMSRGDLESLNAAMDDLVIERYERASDRPGIEPEVRVNADGSEDDIWHKGASPKQLSFQEAFFGRIGRERKSPTVYAIAGGNRAAKSVTVWCLCFCKFIRDYAEDGDIFWCIAPNDDKMKQDVHEWLWEYLPHSMFGARAYTPELGFGTNKTIELRLKGGGTAKLIFKTEQMATDTLGMAHFEATAVKGVAWTEARYEPLLTSLLLRLGDRRGFLLIDYLPCEGWHQERLQDNAEVHHVTFGMKDNAHNLPAGMIQGKMRELAHDPDAIDLRIYGKPRALQGVVLKSFSREMFPDGNMCEPFRVPAEWPLYMGADWGFRAPHSFLLGAVSPNGTIYGCEEDYRADRTVLQTVTDVWEMVNRVRPMKLYPGFASAVEMFQKLSEWAYPRRVERSVEWSMMVEEVDENPIREHVDAEFSRVLALACAIDDQVYQEHGSTGGSLSTEFWRCGLPIQKAQKTIDVGVERMRNLLHHRRLVLFSTCVNHRRDWSSWKFKTKADGSVDPKDRYSEEYKHGCDSGRYLVMLNPTYEYARETA